MHNFSIFLNSKYIDNIYLYLRVYNEFKQIPICVVIFFHLVRGQKPGKSIDFTEQEVTNLCQKVSEILLSQPTLLELAAPLKICGNCIS